MTDIWDEKPNQLIVGAYVPRFRYNAKKIDAWLEKLKAHYEPIEEKARALDAVQGWWNMFNQCIDSEAVKDRLWKILEAF